MFDPAIPDAPRDASAACVVASALLELSTYLPGDKGERYKDAAMKMLKSLSTENYQCGEASPAFLLHSTGHWPAKSEVDASIIYADYYYIEALLRLKRLQEGKPVIG
jgi:unsaturated chondroitin disaccharide hydrolase